MEVNLIECKKNYRNSTTLSAGNHTLDMLLVIGILLCASPPFVYTEAILRNLEARSLIFGLYYDDRKYQDLEAKFRAKRIGA